MDRQTKKVLALVALIVGTGVTAVELTRGPAFAETRSVTGGITAYADKRVGEVFRLVAEMPPAPAVSVAVAEKGDLLPVGCVGPFRADVQAECMDSAYEVASEPSVVVETRTGEAISVLMRLDPMTVAAGF